VGAGSSSLLDLAQDLRDSLVHVIHLLTQAGLLALLGLHLLTQLQQQLHHLHA
jgi:hypothetical protein